MFQARISNSIIEARNPGYKIFDLPTNILLNAANNLTFTNATLRRAHNLDPLCPSLMMRMRGITYEALRNKPVEYDKKWYVLGTIAPGYSNNRLHVAFDSATAYEITVSFNGKSLNHRSRKMTRKPMGIQFKFVEKNGYCIVLFKPEKKAVLFPEITDILGNGNFMGMPDKGKSYMEKDYGIIADHSL